MTVPISLKLFSANQAQYDLDWLAAKISALSLGELRKYEYLIGEDLGYRPSVVEQAKCVYSPLDKIFIKGIEKHDQKEGLLKRLKNIESKIEGRNEEQLEAVKDQSKIVDKKPRKIVLLKDQLDYIFKNFTSNFNSTEKNFLKKLPRDEKKIDYDLPFEINDSIIKDYDLLENVDTLYDLLINLINEN